MRFKKHLDLIDFTQAPRVVQLYTQLWQKENKDSVTPFLSYGDIVEMRLAVSNDLHHDEEDGDGNYYNNVLIGPESVIGWQGAQHIDIEWYQLIQDIKKLIVNRQRESSA